MREAFPLSQRTQIFTRVFFHQLARFDGAAKILQTKTFFRTTLMYSL